MLLIAELYNRFLIFVLKLSSCFRTDNWKMQVFETFVWSFFFFFYLLHDIVQLQITKHSKYKKSLLLQDSWEGYMYVSSQFLIAFDFKINTELCPIWPSFQVLAWIQATALPRQNEVTPERNNCKGFALCSVQKSRNNSVQVTR